MKIIRETQPTCGTVPMLIIILLAVTLVGMSTAFVYLLLSGRGNNYLLGTILAFEFLIGGTEIIVYARYFLPFREVSEDREEELLW